MILFVGLGNPTQKYQATRHNIGFMVIDTFIHDLQPIQISKTNFKGELYKSGSSFFLKPMNFMNLSGESVGAVVNFYKPDRVVVVHDDLDLPLGAVRFKIGGGSGGHNGLKSIDSYIGKEYERVRLGIGKPSNKDQVVSYVLEPFLKSEQESLQRVITHTCKALQKLTTTNLEEVRAMFTCKGNFCD